MNAAHIHLMVNHFPLFAALFSFALLSYGLLKRQDDVMRIGLVIAVLAGLGAFAATRSGEGAEEIVEDYPGVVESAIHDHEEAGEAALWATAILGILALATLLLPARRASLARKATMGTALFALVAFGMIARAATLGGEIRHPEISGTDVPADQDSEDGDEHDG